jgi:hypothetical protein
MVMWGYLIAGVVTLVVVALGAIVVVVQHLWLPIVMVGLVVVAGKAVGSYRRSRDDTYGVPPAFDVHGGRHG